MRKVKDARLVLFSDDIANIVESVEKLLTIHRHLTVALSWFGMVLDDTKALFIRFGDCDVQSITLPLAQQLTYTIQFSSTIRYLGFHLLDGKGIDIDHHIRHRCNAASKEYELGVLRWVQKN
jgi:hypothetical protein